jgi:hypothetical protein
MEDVQAQRENLVAGLKRLKMREKDIETALFIGEWMLLMDKTIFGSGKITYVTSPPKNENGLGPGYVADKDIYVVFVEGIYGRMEEIMKKGFLRCWKKGKKWHCPEEKIQRQISPEEFLIATAAHEVRHRIQNKREVELFSPIDSLDYLIPPFGELLFYASKWKKNFPKAHEFDATVISFFLLHLYRYCDTLQEIKELLLIEPSKLRKKKAA